MAWLKDRHFHNYESYYSCKEVLGWLFSISSYHQNSLHHPACFLVKAQYMRSHNPKMHIPSNKNAKSMKHWYTIASHCNRVPAGYKKLHCTMYVKHGIFPNGQIQRCLICITAVSDVFIFAMSHYNCTWNTHKKNDCKPLLQTLDPQPVIWEVPEMDKTAVETCKKETKDTNQSMPVFQNFCGKKILSLLYFVFCEILFIKAKKV